jgi:hypothetical protein
MVSRKGLTSRITYSTDRCANATANRSCEETVRVQDIIPTDRSRAEKLWLVCGVMGDVMLCDRERDIHPSQKLYATIHSEKNDFPHNSVILQTLISSSFMFS